MSDFVDFLNWVSSTKRRKLKPNLKKINEKRLFPSKSKNEHFFFFVDLPVEESLSSFNKRERKKNGFLFVGVQLIEVLAERPVRKLIKQDVATAVGINLLERLVRVRDTRTP